MHIQNLGFASKVQKNIQVHPKAEIYNSDVSKPITSIVWTQLDPEPLTDQITVFNKDASNNLLNTGCEFRMKMSSFNYMAGSQSVKLRVDVTNSASETAFDIIEFFISEAPFSLTTNFTNVGGTNNQEAMVTNFTINASSWYDSLDNVVQQLEFKTYITLNSRNHLLSPYSSSSTPSLTIPYISPLSTTTSISLCIKAIDPTSATTSV